jgi:hypothetical protein
VVVAGGVAKHGRATLDAPHRYSVDAADVRGGHETMSETRFDLERLSNHDLLERWHEVARQTPATPADVYEELARRNVARVNNLLLVFTLLVTIATVVALAIAVAKP